jgi:polar amino acid transport system substrate-binding protein
MNSQDFRPATEMAIGRALQVVANFAVPGGTLEGVMMFKRAFGIALFSVWSSHLQAAEPVRMAFQEHFPPFVEVKDGKPTGLVVDLVRAAAAKAGIDVDFVPVPFDEVQATLKDGRADAIFPIAITSEREAVFDFSVPLLMTGGAIFVRAPKPTPANLAALSGKTVVTPGTGPLVPYLQKNAPDLKLVITKNYEDSLTKIVNGEADAAALNFQVGASMATRLFPGKVTMPKTMFEELPDTVAVTKGQHADLLKRLNAGIAAIRADGTWEQINKRWIGS